MNNLFQSSKSISQNDWFYWDSTALFKAERQKVLYCPNETNILREKCCTVPIKPRKNLFESSKSISQKDWVYWDSTALSASGP